MAHLVCKSGETLQGKVNVGIPVSIREVRATDQDIDSLVEGSSGQSRLLGNNPQKYRTVRTVVGDRLTN